MVLKDRMPLKITGKSEKPEGLGKLEVQAYWFKVTVAGKSGWIYGKYVHPNPAR